MRIGRRGRLDHLREDWENNSRGGGGSGSPLSASLELGFDLPDGGRVNVELDAEPRRPDGSITTRAGEPFERFDHDHSIGDDSTTITFDSLATVAAGDQDIEVWVAPRKEAPDFLSTTEHKARFEVAGLPNPAAGDDDGYMPASYILTVVHKPDRVDLDTGGHPRRPDGSLTPAGFHRPTVTGMHPANPRWHSDGPAVSISPDLCAAARPHLGS